MLSSQRSAIEFSHFFSLQVWSQAGNLQKDNWNRLSKAIVGPSSEEPSRQRETRLACMCVCVHSYLNEKLRMCWEEEEGQLPLHLDATTYHGTDSFWKRAPKVCCQPGSWPCLLSFLVPRFIRFCVCPVVSHSLQSCHGLS